MKLPNRGVTTGREPGSPKSGVVGIIWPLFYVATVDQKAKEGLITLVGYKPD